MRHGLPARQGRLLFAYLVLHRDRIVRRDELVEALWPQAPPRDPDGALNTLLARLRPVIGHHRLPARGPVRLDLGERAWVDVEAAQAAPATARRLCDEGRPGEALGVCEEALGIIEQPLLAEFERGWLDERRRRLADLLSPLLELAVDASLTLGGAALQRVEPLARRVVEREPYRESAHGALMKVLAARGDTAEALRVFEDLRVRLRDELGVSPASALRSLHERLLTVDPVPLPQHAAEPRAGAAPLAPRDGSERHAAAPAPPSALIGREADVRRVEALLEDPHVRLVTLVGIGGVGKTRLAVELARRRDRERPVAWVALAPLRDAADVAPAIAHAIGVAPCDGESLARALDAQDILLFLDNVEHLLAAAPLVADLLTGTSRLKVLATSREALRLRAEHVFAVHPLGLPASDAPDLEQLTRAPATALFVATAGAHDPSFAPSAADAAAIAEICRQVDGLPLAIELAAGRLGLVSPRELAGLVAGGLDALATAMRDAPEHQRSLRATLAWSHRLLTAGEQSAFARFAVFSGGADLDAAQGVTGAGLDTLQALCDKHLLTRADEQGARRLDMLETVRQYAREQLAARAEEPEVARRHAEHFLARAERAAPELQLRAPAELVRALERELANLRAAMRWLLENARPEDCLRLAMALSVLWYKIGTDEGARWLRAGLEAAAERLPPREHVTALNALALQLAEARTGPESEATSRRALSLARRIGDPAATSIALVNLAFALIVQHRGPEAHPIAAEAVAVAGATGDPRLLADAHVAQAACAPDNAMAIAAARRAAEHFEQTSNTGRLIDIYCNLTYLSLVQGNDDDALDYIERAGRLAERDGTDTDRAYVLGNEGLARLMTGDVPGAERAFRAQLRLARRRLVTAALGEGLYGLAAVYAAHGEADLAARLQGAAGTFTDDHVHPMIRQRLDDLFFASQRARIGERRWERLAAAGRQLSPDAVIALANGEPPRPEGSLRRSPH